MRTWGRDKEEKEENDKEEEDKEKEGKEEEEKEGADEVEEPGHRLQQELDGVQHIAPNHRNLRGET